MDQAGWVTSAGSPSGATSITVERIEEATYARSPPPNQRDDGAREALRARRKDFRK